MSQTFLFIVPVTGGRFLQIKNSLIKNVNPLVFLYITIRKHF